MVRRFFVVACIFALFAACGERKEPVVAETNPMPPPPASTSTPSPTPSPSPPTPTAQKLHFEVCVMNAGGAKASATKSKVNDAAVVETKHTECHYGAECVRQPGNAQPGDGFVGLSCTDKHCTCTRREAIGPRKEDESFDLEELCGSAELAKRLLIERCMAGMPPPLNADGG